MTANYVTDLSPDPRDTDAVLSLDPDDHLAETVRAYWSLAEGPKRQAFLDLQSDDAQEAIEADRAGRRAALLGTLWANRRPAAAHAAD